MGTRYRLAAPAPRHVRETLAGVLLEITASLPQGLPLPESTWRHRHCAILALLWIHVAVISVAALALGLGTLSAVVDGVIPASMALLASERGRSRRFRATVASLGLASSSALLVHLSHGNIEMHFHFFVLVVVITLYQDWVPFLATIAFVALHHGVFGVLDPTAVYNHRDAWEHPWKWAAIHAAFVLAASAAGVVSWRLNEGARELTELILNAAGDGIYVLDAQNNVVFANPATGKMIGRDVTSIMGASEAALVTGGHELSAALPDALPGAPVVDGAFDRHAGNTVIRREDGSAFTVEFVATPLLERGRAHGAVVTINDTTERMRAEEALRTSEERFRLLFANNPHAMWVYDSVTLRFLEVNDAAVAQYGYSRDEFAEMSVAEIAAPDSDSLPMADEALMSSERVAAESMHRRKTGETFAVALTSHRIRFAERVAVLVVAEDISDRLRFEQELAHQALHDPLTGLPNRVLLGDRLERAMQSGYRDGRSVGVLFLDLDGFKVINDGLGHSIGDELLVAVGERLAGQIAPADTIARFGGDEFVILLENVEDIARVTDVADRVLRSLRAAVPLLDRDVFVTASVGIATHTGGGSSAEAHDLLRRADIAMYRAKASGKAQAVHFQNGMDPRAINRLDLETDLRLAVERDEWELVYQPEIDLRTGHLVGMEALVRWRHPERGVVSPAEFIPLAEETGLITSIGDWVLREACRQTRAWQIARPSDPPLVVGVNVSALQLAQRDFADKVRVVLGECDLAPASLRLEVTESTAMRDPAGTIGMLEQIRDLGVELAIDDFGTGYSSLSYLSSLPVQVLKIDQAFVRALADERGGIAIVNAIVAVAHTLGMQVTAEGVETHDQLVSITGLGCDRGQGYYLARPLDADRFGELISPPKLWRIGEAA